MRASSSNAISVPVGFDGEATMTADGALGPVPLDQLGGELIVGRGIHRYAHRLAFHGAHEVPVGRVRRIGGEHLVAGRQQHAHGEQQRPRGSAGHRDARGRHVQTVARAVPAGQRLAQRGYPEGRGVADLPGLQRRDSGTDHRLRRGEVRLADDHVDDAAALRLELLGARDQRHHMERLDGRHAGGETVRLGEPLRSVHGVCKG